MNDGQTNPEVGHATAQAQMPQLTRQHLDWVYCLCLRSVRDPALAEDVTQCVFMAFLKKSGRMPPEANISGWLFKTARHCCNRALRNANTRRRHERAAARMRPDAVAVEAPMRDEELIPLLDEQIARLGQADRTALLLRYYERRSLREVGDALGISEEAAKKRVQRAVDKLRSRLTRKQIPLGAEALTAILADKLVQPAPVKLAAAILAHATHGTTATVMSASQSKISAHVSLKALASGKTALAATGAVLATALVAAGIAVALAKHSHPKAPQKLIISRATTYITSPLDKDGLPDYVAAWNKVASEGITPENNAAVPMLRLLLASYQREKWAAQFATELKGYLAILHALPAKAPLIREPIRFISSRIPANRYTLAEARTLIRGAPNATELTASAPFHNSLRTCIAETEEEIGLRVPWTGSQCQLLLQYIQSQEPISSYVRALSRLPKFYFPMVATARFGPLASARLPLLSLNTQATFLLVMDANLSTGRGDFQSAMRDLLAVRRLARFNMRNALMIQMLVGAAALQHAVSAERNILASDTLTAKLAERYLRQIEKSSPVFRMDKSGQLCHRFETLDWLTSLYKRSDNIGLPMKIPHWNAPLPVVLRYPPPHLNWNWQFRQLNQLDSRWNREVQRPLFSVTGLAGKHGSYRKLARWKMLLNTRPSFDNRAFRDAFAVFTLDNGKQVQVIINRSRAAARLNQIGFALAAYHAEHHVFPATLRQLRPAFIKRIPDNPLTGRPMHYVRRHDGGYTLLATSPDLNPKHSGQFWMEMNEFNLVLQIPEKPQPVWTRAKLP